MREQGRPLVPFLIPADFILERVCLDVDALGFGVAQEWLDEASLRALIAAARGTAKAFTDAEEDHLVALARDDLYRQDAHRAFEEARMERVVGIREPARIWLYLALDYLRRHRDAFGDTFEIIRWLYSEFGYPEEIDGFTGWNQPPPGEGSGIEAMERRWERYLDEARRRYGVGG